MAQIGTLTEFERHIKHLRVGHAHQTALPGAEVGSVYAPPSASTVVDIEITWAV